MSAEPKRLGRPPLLQTKKRFSIRLLPEDCEAFGAAAKKARRGMTTWMRETCRAAVGLPGKPADAFEYHEGLEGLFCRVDPCDGCGRPMADDGVLVCKHCSHDHFCGKEPA